MEFYRKAALSGDYKRRLSQDSQVLFLVLAPLLRVARSEGCILRSPIGKKG